MLKNEITQALGAMERVDLASENITNAGTSAWKMFRPAGGETTSRLSRSTKVLAARYLSGEIGRSMTEDNLHLSMPGYHTIREWECDWTLAGPLINNSDSPVGLAAEDLLLDCAKTMEEVKHSANVLPECFHSVHGKIHFKELFSSALVHSAAYCFTEIVTASACILPLSLDCDWYCSIFVNGELKHTGAGLSKIIRLPLKAGRNFIGFRITGGSGGWRVILAKGEFLSLEEKCREPDQVELYAEAVRLIALNAPLRIIDGEKLVGAATLKKAMGHIVPALCCPSVSHTTLGFEKALAVGYKGIRKEIEERLSRGGLDESGNKLLHAMLSCLDSAKIWHGRYLDELKKLSGEDEKHLDGIMESLKNVPENPPETFREAVQSLWLLWNFQRLCGNLIAIGRIDKMLGHYLKRDLAAGIIGIDEARELIAHFWIKGCEWITANTDAGGGDAQFWQNIVLGGVDEAGNDVANEVTYLVLDVVEELHISDFPIAVRISKKSDEMLLRRIAEIQRLGGGIIAVYNDDRIIPNLVDFGYPLSEARDFANDGCWEILIPGKTCFGYLPFDALIILQDVLGLDASDADLSQYTCFDELFEGFKIKLNNQIVQITSRVVTALRNNGTPTVLADMLIDGCIEKGRSYYNLGPKYTAESPHAGGLPDVANSLQVIKKLVYEDQEFSLAELADILRNNWEGHEETRRKICSRFDFYGNDSEASNAMIQKVFDAYTGLVAGIPSNNGVLFPAGISTFGREANAFLPGRTASAAGSKKGDILALNFSPSPGTDKRGPTAVIKSHCAVDFSRLPGGTALELKILPSSLLGEEGIAALVGLMRSFVSLGGIFMQIDAVDTAMLRDAQEHPDKYPNLSVRVSGWSARFATLSKNYQEMLIVRSEQRVS